MDHTDFPLSFSHKQGQTRPHSMSRNRKLRVIQDKGLMERLQKRAASNRGFITSSKKSSKKKYVQRCTRKGFCEF